MSKRISQWLFFIIALLILGAVWVIGTQQMQAQTNGGMPGMGGPPGAGGPPPGAKPPAAAPAESPKNAAPASAKSSPKSVSPALAEVSVLTVSASSHPAYISAYGAVEPHFQLDLTAQVAGQIEKLSDKLDSGQQVSKDEVLIKLEDSSYRSALAEAQSTLADAQLAYEQEQQQSQQAQQEWKASGLAGKPSNLVLRKPQLAAAQASLARARAAVETARINLKRTEIRAPFDAVVMSRAVSLGAYIQGGGSVATLYSTDWVEVPIYLSEREWAQLPSVAELQTGNWPVMLHSALSNAHWQGRVLRQTQHLDAETRLRGLVLALDKPLASEPPLLPGAFIKAELQGRSIDGVWSLPASALSQQGEVWYVKNGALAKFSTEPLFSNTQQIYIHPPEELAAQPQQVLTHPLNAYVPGMEVKAVEVKDE